MLTRDRAVFLSGNGPLVEVLREALTRDELTPRHAKRTHQGQSEGVHTERPSLQG